MLRVCTFIHAILSVIVMLVMNPERAVNAPGGTFFVDGWFSSNTVANMAYFVIDYWMCSRVLHIR